MVRAPYHPRTVRNRVRGRGRGRLRLRDASAMAIGGMIGGGIFSVLGVTVDLPGHLPFGCFILDGAIALVTAHSYATLSLRAGRSGGPFLPARSRCCLAFSRSWHSAPQPSSASSPW